jgi:hypothetical protein
MGLCPGSNPHQKIHVSKEEERPRLTESAPMDGSLSLVRLTPSDNNGKEGVRIASTFCEWIGQNEWASELCKLYLRRIRDWIDLAIFYAL